MGVLNKQVFCSFLSTEKLAEILVGGNHLYVRYKCGRYRLG